MDSKYSLQAFMKELNWYRFTPSTLQTLKNFLEQRINKQKCSKPLVIVTPIRSGETTLSAMLGRPIRANSFTYV
jgi:hypothetical protein